MLFGSSWEDWKRKTFFKVSLFSLSLWFFLFFGVTTMKKKTVACTCVVNVYVTRLLCF